MISALPFEQRACFIAGQAKSGTTLLVALLDSHPELLVLPEETAYFATVLTKYAPRGRRAQFDYLTKQSLSNVLFGGLQRISAEQVGVSPVLMAAANSSGGVMGKMIDAQSIVVASSATKWYGHEGTILRFVFFHSLALAALVGLLVLGQAYLWPLKLLVP